MEEGQISADIVDVFRIHRNVSLQHFYHLLISTVENFLFAFSDFGWRLCWAKFNRPAECGRNTAERTRVRLQQEMYSKVWRNNQSSKSGFRRNSYYMQDFFPFFLVHWHHMWIVKFVDNLMLYWCVLHRRRHVELNKWHASVPRNIEYLFYSTTGFG